MAKRPNNQTVSLRTSAFFKVGLSFSGLRLLQFLILLAAVVWIYGPVLHGDWLWDDDVDITHNAITQSPDGFWSIWFKPGSQLDYYPVKASVQWLQWRLCGDDPFGYHLTNLLLHLVSALLVWRLFQKLGLKLAWLGGLIFAVHPVQVESVAWIAELKNTLSLPFFLLAMIEYLDFDRSRRRRDYFLALGFFLLAMLSKPTMVMFPVVILLHAWWKRGRIEGEDLKASAPFFVVSLVLGWIALQCALWYSLEHHLAYRVPELGGVLPRLALAGSSLSFYLGKVVCPVGLLPIYPQWKVAPPTLLELLPWPVLAVLLVWFWRHRAGWGRHMLFGFGFFLITLVPFVSVRVPGFMDFTWVMDHFLYIPILGLIGLAVAGLEQAANRMPRPVCHTGAGLLVVIVAAMIVQSRNYAGKFVSQEALWTYTLARNPEAWPAHNNLGNILYSNNQLAPALAQYEAVERLNPSYIPSRCAIGHIRHILGDLDGALVAYNQAIAISTNEAEIYYCRAQIRMARGDWDDALADLQMATSVEPHSIYADYAHLLIWRVRLAKNQTATAGPELAAALAHGWNAAPDEWSTTVARFLLGESGEPAFFAAALSPVPDTEREQVCEAWYFVGLRRLSSGDRAAAAADFRKCLSTGLKTSTEYMLARAELKAPGVNGN